MELSVWHIALLLANTFFAGFGIGALIGSIVERQMRP